MRRNGFTVGPPISRALGQLAAFERLSVGVEEAACQRVGYAQLGRLAVEYYLRVGCQTLGSGENLQRNVLSHDLYYLSQTAADGRKLVIAYARRTQRDRGFGNVVYLGIYFLKCTCCHNYAYLADLSFTNFSIWRR